MGVLPPWDNGLSPVDTLRRPQASRWAVRCHRYGRRTAHGSPSSGSGPLSIFQLPAVTINIEDQQDPITQAY
ncbi:hypothetical protein GCM10010219_65090 [Streptomyces netropsis]|nr:hypothetical protein GCM10010219_65090 [Streptomyces netropsis]